VSFATRVLVALLAGIGGGLVLTLTGWEYTPLVIGVVEPIGTLFMNAIRMTVIPLVTASLVVGVASAADPSRLARMGMRGGIAFLVLLVISGAIGALVAPRVLTYVSLDPQAALALRESAASASAGLATTAAQNKPTISGWLVALVPSNPIKSAADGAMLPLIVFALLLGLALTRVRDDLRRQAVVVFQAIADAMLVLVRWILVLAPIGVFALSLPLIARLGFSALGALAIYVITVSVATVLYAVLVLYPAAAIFGGVPLAQFARAAAPGQAVAFSTRSSLAALPAVIEAARTRLRYGESITGFFLPFAASVFRPGAAIGLTIGTLFLARLYGVPMGPAEIATIVFTAVATSFSIPGVPAGSIVAMVPVLASVGLPADGLGILLGVDAIPDGFRTTTNVTGQMAAATIAARAPGLDEATPDAVIATA
jgi:proton glutamate symport protein